MCASIGTCACPAESRHTEVLQQRFPEVSDCLIKIDPHCRHWSLPSIPMVKQVNQPFPFSITCHLKSSLYFIKLSHSILALFMLEKQSVSNLNTSGKSRSFSVNLQLMITVILLGFLILYKVKALKNTISDLCQIIVTKQL